MEHIPQEQRKKVLLLADDIRLPSGVGSISREIVMNTAHVINWVQIGAMITNPDYGKIIDISDDIKKHLGYDDIKTLIYPSNGYGNPQLLRQIIELEKPDAIMIFTDPRYWVWLFEMEYELHQKNIPIIYYHVWDNVPFSYYNKPYFDSCDTILAISKLSYNNVKHVVGKENVIELDNELKSSNKLFLSYVPHGINKDVFFPVDENDEEYKTFVKSKINKDYKFIVFFNNRNIRRKMASDVMLSFKKFIDDNKLDKNEILLYMHTTISDQAGTDLNAVKNTLAEGYNILLDESVYNTKHLNYLYNMCDLTINIANAEGFGLSTAESLMSGTPILVNVTGGLQDQCGFKNNNGEYLSISDFDDEFKTNSIKKYERRGNWCYTVFPAVITCNGSPSTPYIYDDNVSINDVANQLYSAYVDKITEKSIKNNSGRQYLIENGFESKDMCEGIVNGILNTIEFKKINNNIKITKV